MEVAHAVRVLLELPAQLIDGDAQALDVSGMFGSPQRFEQSVVRNWLALMQHEISQEFKFRGGQMHLIRLDDHTAPLEINLQARRLVWRDGFRAGNSPPECVHARQQFMDAERFDEVVIGAGVKSLHLVFLRAQDADYEDGYVKQFANSAAGLESADARHFEIQQNELDSSFCLNFFQRFLAGPCFNDHVTCAG